MPPPWVQVPKAELIVQFVKPESDPMSSGADVWSTVTVSTVLSGTIRAGYTTEGVT